MKRVITAILLLLILTSSIPSLAAKQNEVLYATEPVFLREGPGASYAIIVELEACQPVILLAKEGNWVKVNSRDTIGYVFGKYLTDADLGQSIPGIALAGVNVRAGEGTNFKVLGKLKKGQILPTFGARGSWVEVWWNGKKAYVHGEYFEFYGSKNEGEAMILLVELRVSNYFETNHKIFIGEYITADRQLGIRISRSANKTKVYNDLKKILNSENFKLVVSNLPANANAQFIEERTEDISKKIEKLTPAQSEQCLVAGWGYDVAKDKIVVEIVDLNASKIKLFKRWIANWPYLAFETSSGISIPKI